MPLSDMSAGMAYAVDVFSKDGPVNIDNCCFAALFLKQDPSVVKVISSEVKKANPRIRLVFCTVVVGMGFDSQSIISVAALNPNPDYL